VRKVRELKESATSLFWMTKTDDDDETVDIVACRGISKSASVSSVCTAITYFFFNGDINKSNDPTPNGIKIIVDGPRYEDEKERPGGSEAMNMALTFDHSCTGLFSTSLKKCRTKLRR
jgi:hypothetical protein